MSLAGPPGLDADSLHLVVFGPGYGESVAVRVPPGQWLVVDSLTASNSGSANVPALAWIEREGGEIAGVVLTHPHDDHAAGIPQLLDAHAAAFAGCVPDGGVPRGWDEEPDAEEHLRRGAVSLALAAIRARWESAPAARWELVAGSQREVGEGRVTVLFPDSSSLADRRAARMEPNRLAAPLLVEWRDVRLVLGSDLLAVGWRLAARLGLRLHAHHAFKVAHHGSKGAFAEEVVGVEGGRGRCWLITPWNRGRSLPRFEEREGIAALLASVDEVFLTALPFEGAGPVPPLTRRTRRELARERGTGRGTSLPGGLTLTPIPAPSRCTEGWISIRFVADGRIGEIRGADGTLVVVEEGEPRARPLGRGRMG